VKLSSLVASGFKAFAREVSFDLSPDTTVIVARNGQGKTSFFDAILWAITGRIGRLGKQESVASLYSESGEARVAVGLRTDSGKNVEVVRTSIGGLSVLIDGRQSRGREAEDSLVSLMWPDAMSAEEPIAALAAAIERSVYLQQDMVRTFIDAQDARERFVALSEMMGAGRVVELQRTLEESRNLWSRATNSLNEEAEVLRRRLAALEARAVEVEPQTVAPELSSWEDWWNEAIRFGDVQPRSAVPATSPSAPSAIDGAMRELDAKERALSRVVSRLQAVLTDLEVPHPVAAELERLRGEGERVTQALQEARDALRSAQARAAEERARQVRETDTRHQRATLAQIALRFIDGPCPVCGQPHDKDRTREDLMRIIEAASAHSDDVGPNQVGVLADEVRSHEQLLAGIEGDAAEKNRTYQTWIAARDEALEVLRELGVEDTASDDLVESLEEEARKGRDHIERIVSLRTRGERLALAIARLGESTRQAELRDSLVSTRAELTELDSTLSGRYETSELIKTLISALRDSLSEVSVQQLSELQPLLQRIYSTVDPHPSFTVVQLLTNMKGGRGKVIPSVTDPLFEFSAEASGAVLSSSQMNVLAVSIFLAMNLGIAKLPLTSTLLDDPLQSLDDVNLLGLVDLLRRMRDRRQLIVSTHEDRFGGLLERKLRPVSPSQSTQVIELSGWSRYGPNVEQRGIQAEVSPVRLVG
jgi:DNA repair exonuclease SbcCD ATPase subunit